MGLLDRFSAELVGGRGDAMERVVRAAHEVWRGDAAAAVRFWRRPNALLDGRTPLDVATESTVGADLVVELLGAAQAGVAV